MNRPFFITYDIFYVLNSNTKKGADEWDTFFKDVLFSSSCNSFDTKCFSWYLINIHTYISYYYYDALLHDYTYVKNA